MADSDWMKFKQIRGKTLPERIDFNGASFHLEQLFKRDFYAATGLYRIDAVTFGIPTQIVLKIYHTESLGLIPLAWLGRRQCKREVFYYRAIEGIPGLSRFLGRFGDSGYVREYVPGCHLREYRKQHQPGTAFYAVLREMLGRIHARGLSHNDLSKPENILVRPDGSPTIIDFQIASRFAYRLPILKQLGNSFLRYLQSLDRYHLDKHHRRGRPQDFSAEELRQARKKGVALFLHGHLVRRPYRVLRHFVMGRFLRVKETAITLGESASAGKGSSHSSTAPTLSKAA